MRITPHYYQTAAKQAVFDYFESGNKGNPLVCLPTGTGKSVCIADLVYSIFSMYPTQRMMMLTHVAKLIEQNAKKLYDFWPTAPIGIHSAGLKHRDIMMPLIYGGVQSVVKNIKDFGHRDLLLVDEAHLISPNEDTQYGEVIEGLKEINPRLKVIGYTATPYRMKMGMITDGGIFTDICYDLTDFENFNKLIAEGYLGPLIAKPTNTIIDISNVGISAGDYNQKQSETVIDTDEITYSAVKEVIEFGHNRHTWMLFAAGVKNAEHIASMLQSFNIPAAAVHSKLSDKENEARLKSYERGELRAIVGANMLTTGYDNPRIDLIADLQPTVSPGKHVQKLGRGTRVYREYDYPKNNCLVLDFVGNIARNGPINDPVKPRKPGEATGDVPVKLCPQCGAYNHAAARFCCNCAEEFPFHTKLFRTAKSDNPLKGNDPPKIEIIDVKGVVYSRHEGRDKIGNGTISPPTVKATYFLGLRPVNKFLCFEHVGLPRKLAHDWWKKHSIKEPPNSITEFLFMSERGELRIPKKVTIHSNLKYPEIIDYEF